MSDFDKWYNSEGQVLRDMPASMAQAAWDYQQARIDALECCLVDVTQNAKYMGQAAAINAYFVDSAFIHKATELLEAEK